MTDYAFMFYNRRFSRQEIRDYSNTMDNYSALEKENNKKTWSGRFNEPVSALVARYTASIGFDQRLAEYDIQGSLAHAQMLSLIHISEPTRPY